MNTEIERKFLIEDWSNWITAPHSSYIIYQYYIDDGTRIRIKHHSDGSNKACITHKYQKSNITREEWEFDINADEANDYFQYLIDNKIGLGRVKKTRHIIRDSYAMTWEIDVFHDENEGLILAEIEMPNEEFEFHKPEYIGKEVTNDERYYNCNLAKNPYSEWKYEG